MFELRQYNQMLDKRLVPDISHLWYCTVVNIWAITVKLAVKLDNPATNLVQYLVKPHTLLRDGITNIIQCILHDLNNKLYVA